MSIRLLPNGIFKTSTQHVFKIVDQNCIYFTYNYFSDCGSQMKVHSGCNVKASAFIRSVCFLSTGLWLTLESIVMYLVPDCTATNKICDISSVKKLAFRSR